MLARAGGRREGAQTLVRDDLDGGRLSVVRSSARTTVSTGVSFSMNVRAMAANSAPAGMLRARALGGV